MTRIERGEGPNEGEQVQGGNKESAVQVIGRVADMLRLLGESPGGLTQAEVAVRLRLPRTTVHRIARTLITEGILDLRGPNAKLRLGNTILRLAEAERGYRAGELHPRLMALSREIRETVNLAVLEGGQVLFVDQVISQQQHRAVSGIGLLFPAHCTAPGKAMLASLKASEVDELLPEELEVFTPRTIATREQLHEELARVRERGYAFDIEEHAIGVAAISVSLQGTAFGTMSLSVPMAAHRFEQNRPAIVDALVQGSDRMYADWARAR